MHGNVWEWVADCWHENYKGAPSDGSIWLDKACTHSVLRGGSWSFKPDWLRSTYRFSNKKKNKGRSTGFRLAFTEKVVQSSDLTTTEIKFLDHKQGVGEISFLMKAIKGGGFYMGCLSEQCSDNEAPRHSVEVADFYLAETETTWEFVSAMY